MAPEDHIEFDGRSSKFMNKEMEITVAVDPDGNEIKHTFQSNVFQFVFKHPPGYQHDVMIILEVYVE